MPPPPLLCEGEEIWPQAHSGIWASIWNLGFCQVDTPHTQRPLGSHRHGHSSGPDPKAASKARAWAFQLPECSQTREHVRIIWKADEMQILGLSPGVSSSADLGQAWGYALPTSAQMIGNKPGGQTWSLRGCPPLNAHLVLGTTCVRGGICKRNVITPNYSYCWHASILILVSVLRSGLPFGLTSLIGFLLPCYPASGLAMSGLLAFSIP